MYFIFRDLESARRLFVHVSSFVSRLKNSLKRLLPDPLRALDPHDAYQLWANTYDDVGSNALIFSDQRAILPELQKLELGGRKILDIGCGTGRYLQVLQDFEPRILVGVDFSEEMLQKVRPKIRAGNTVCLQRARIEHLPYKHASFDFALCTLALDHVPDLSRAVAELSRILAKGGSMIISVFHPQGKSLNWQRTFKANNGQSRLYAVKYYSHRVSDYFSAFRDAGLSVKDVLEPLIDERCKPFYEMARRPDLYEQFKGFSLLLVFSLAKQ